LFTYNIGYWGVNVFRGIFSSGGGGYVRGSSHGGSFYGEIEFSMKGAPDFPALLKKRSEINLKSFFNRK